MAEYYDYVLGLIPLALFGTVAALGAVGVQLAVAAPVGAALATLLVGHALFVNGPDGAAASRTADDAGDRPAEPSTGAHVAD